MVPLFHGKWYLYLSSSLLIFIPVFMWQRCIKNILKFKKENEEMNLFLKRHNCCVFYIKDKGFSGWPPNIERLSIDWRNKESLYEPLLYFLRTARWSLDIAVMMFNVNIISETLLEQLKKGVKIRIILSLKGEKNEIHSKLERAGATIRYHTESIFSTSIMHHKYAIKDYFNSTGYVLFGSMNWTHSAFSNNYEDITFLDCPAPVKAFHDDFTQIWDFLEQQYATNVAVKTILLNQVSAM